MDGGQGGAGTRVVSLSDVSAFGRLEEGSGALVTRELGGGRLAGGELEEIAGVGWMAEMAVEPPLVKGHVDERSDRSVVVRERLGGDIESIHARMENRCDKLGSNEKDGKGKTLTDMSLHVSSRDEGKERKERESEHGQIVS